MKLLKNKTFRFMIAAQALLLLVGILNLFGKNAVYEYGAEDMHANFGVWSEELGGYTAEGAEGTRGNMVDAGPIALPAGVYRVAMQYHTDTNMQNLCTVTKGGRDDLKTLQTNGGHMYAGKDATDFMMWLYEDTQDLMVHAYYDGSGAMTVTGLTITQTNVFGRMWIFAVLVISAAVNLCYAYRRRDRMQPFSAQDKTVVFGLGVILLFASLPLMTDYLLGGGDLVYHLMRIEGIKDNLLAGNFPGRISPEWLQGYGYASPIFYGETLLYIAALFRLIGFSVQTSYKMFFFLIGAANVLISYFCFRKIFQEKYIGLLCSMLYTLSVYRIYKTYCCGSFGECFGVLFLPFLAYGFFQTFSGDLNDKNYGRSWIPLTIGFTGLVQSHLLSGEMAGFFTVLLCLVCIRKVFRPKTFVVLVKTVVYTVLLSAWFLVPFLDYMRSGDFVIQHVSARTIQERGLYPAHLLSVYAANGENVFFDSVGMAKSAPLGPGAPLAALFLWALILFLSKTDKLTKTQLRLGQIAGGFAVLSMLMSLSVFPWNSIQRLHPVLATLVSSLQFPNRWISVATLMLTLVAGVVAKWVLEYYHEKGLAVYFICMGVMVLVSALYLTNDLLYTVSPLRLYNQEGMGSGYISGAEYLPYQADASKYWYGAPHAEENVEVAAYQKGSLSMEVTCVNHRKTEGALELPLLYYKGYHAYDESRKETLPVYCGTNFTVGVALPAGYEGTVKVFFESPWYWRAAEAVSLFTGIGLTAGVCRRKQKEKDCA